MLKIKTKCKSNTANQKFYLAEKCGQHLVNGKAIVVTQNANAGDIKCHKFVSQVM